LSRTILCKLGITEKGNEKAFGLKDKLSE